MEGVIFSEAQAERLRRIRENARYVVAVGACACTGKPSTSRNRLGAGQVDERIRWYLDHFDYAAGVGPIGETVVLDDMVRGCPMKAEDFVETLQKYPGHFGVA